jgi:carbamoyltransferase
MKVLGINAYAHDAGVALVVDGRVEFAIEEERLNRIPKTKAFPIIGLDYLQEEMGLRLEDLDHIVIPWHPPSLVKMGAKLVLGNFPPAVRMLGESASPVSNLPAAVKLVQSPRDVAGAFGTLKRPRIQYIPHHRAHACNAFYLSPFETSAVLVMDGYGDACSTSWHVAGAGGVRMLQQNHPLESIGILYAVISMHLGYRIVFDEGRVMALAALGTDALHDRFSPLVKFLPNGGYRINHKLFSFRRYGHARPFTREFFERFGPTRKPWEPITQYHTDLAHALQRMTETAILHVARGLQQATRERNLCFSGGVALNCVANTLLSADSGFEQIHITHSPSDSGTALGAALSCSFASEPSMARSIEPEQQSPFLGPEYSDAQYREALSAGSLGYSEPPNIVEATAKLLARGKCVAWFQNRAEYGPRSLGNRSILADPRDPAIPRHLNREIKQREWFRPFGPTVLAEHASEYFQLDQPSPHMSFAVPVRPERRHDIPAAASSDGLSRIQTLTREQNPLFYSLIEAFYSETGVPMLLNTSFNINEPTVCTPSDAVATFLGSKLDALVIGPFIVERK